jgi:hypothetical protein
MQGSLMFKVAVPANICIDIKECSSMPQPFAYPVFVDVHGTIIASYIDWNKIRPFPSGSGTNYICMNHWEWVSPFILESW